MSRRSRYDDLAYGADDASPRWDRDRFERVRARSRGAPVAERESIRFDERDYGGGRKDISFSDRFDERPRRRTDYYEDDYMPPRRSRPEYLDRDPYQETAGREVAPWRHRYEAPVYDSPAPARRPGNIRRQSSWDAHDRPRARYDDRGERDLDVSVRINSPPRAPDYPPRAPDYPPPREHRYAYPDDDEEDYRDVRIRREREIFRRSASRPARRRESDVSIEVDDSISHTSVREPSPPPKKIKRGRTKMPKRLVHKKAIVDLGFDFVEEEDFYMVQVAMSKDQIDTVIKVSETYRSVYSGEDAPRQLEAPPPVPAPEPVLAPPPPPPAPEPVPSHADDEPAAEGEVTEVVTRKIITNPTPEEIAQYEVEERSNSASESGGKAKSTHTVRSPSPARTYHSRGRSRAGREEFDFEERIDERESQGGALTLVDRSRGGRRSERDIKEEIRQLEAEKKALRYEREDRDNTVRVEKDRNGACPRLKLSLFDMKTPGLPI